MFSSYSGPSARHLEDTNKDFLQYFNNEEYEAEQYDKYLKEYEDASLKTNWSLAFLNFGQNLIFRWEDWTGLQWEIMMFCY